MLNFFIFIKNFPSKRMFFGFSDSSGILCLITVMALELEGIWRTSLLGVLQAAIR